MTDGLLPILDADGMRAADRATMEEWGVPGRVLMETAGRAAADAICARRPVRGARVVVLAGKGNNGGDALVVARVLAARGAQVTVYTMALTWEGERAEGTTPDAAANFDLLRRTCERDRRIRLSFAPAREKTVTVASPEIIVDGLLGIGAEGPLREPVRWYCQWVNRWNPDAFVVALDVPTGLDATTGRAEDHAVCADLTVAFGALKAGLVLGRGPEHAGEVVAVEIGIPDAELERHAAAHRATRAWVAACLPRRAPDAHKYSAGTAVCVVGSGHFTGAAVLSTAAAYRAGAGAVVACTPQSAQATVDARNPEVMVEAQPETAAGTLAADALGGILERAAGADAVLVGCGLGREPETLDVVRQLVGRVEAPLVLDADGLAAYAGESDRLAERGGPLVLTPHLGELRRLLGDDGFTPESRIETARELAARWGAVLVLKGMPSVVGAPDGRVAVGPPGAPALATAGTGDVLAGVLVGLLAQGLEAFEAAVCALHLGTAAADLWTRRHGAAGLVASDLLARLPRAARALRQSVGTEAGPGS